MATATPWRIVWRVQAYEDLRGIVRYIAQDNPRRAASFGRELRARVELLAQQPRLGRQGRPGLPAWLRELVVHANYIVFYRLLERSHSVEILRVKHAAQQIP